MRLPSRVRDRLDIGTFSSLKTVKQQRALLIVPSSFLHVVKPIEFLKALIFWRARTYLSERQVILKSLSKRMTTCLSQLF